MHNALEQYLRRSIALFLEQTDFAKVLTKIAMFDALTTVKFDHTSLHVVIGLVVNGASR